MMKKIIATFLTLGLLATILPLAVQAGPGPSTADVDLVVKNVSIVRLDEVGLYNTTYRLYNHGPDDIINADFWDASGYKPLLGQWYVHMDSLIEHNAFYLDANHYSPYYSWEGYWPTGPHWWCVCTDEYDDVDETDDDNNCVVGFKIFR
jgi:hypothetical protein